MTNSDYETVWDGAHRNCDADLLFGGIRSPTPPIDASPLPAPESISERYAVFDVLPTQRDRALSIGEIQIRSGASYSSASQALFRLRKEGILHSEAIPGRPGRSGLPPRVYWRRA